MALPTEVRFRSINGDCAIYYFQNVGDELPEHTHPIGHDIVVVAGGFHVSGKVNGKQIDYDVEAPHKIYIQSPNPHSITATIPNSIAVNIFERR